MATEHAAGDHRRYNLAKLKPELFRVAAQRRTVDRASSDPLAAGRRPEARRNCQPIGIITRNPERLSAQQAAT